MQHFVRAGGARLCERGVLNWPALRTLLGSLVAHERRSLSGARSDVRWLRQSQLLDAVDQPNDTADELADDRVRTLRFVRAFLQGSSPRLYLPPALAVPHGAILRDLADDLELGVRELTGGGIELSRTALVGTGYGLFFSFLCLTRSCAGCMPDWPCPCLTSS